MQEQTEIIGRQTHSTLGNVSVRGWIALFMSTAVSIVLVWRAVMMEKLDLELLTIAGFVIKDYIAQLEKPKSQQQQEPKA
jgi:tryptophan-rich sensory protein